MQDLIKDQNEDILSHSLASFRLESVGAANFDNNAFNTDSFNFNLTNLQNQSLIKPSSSSLIKHSKSPIMKSGGVNDRSISDSNIRKQLSFLKCNNNNQLYN